MKEECLICKAPLEYLKEDIMMECVICGKKEMSKTRCVKGHYVCNECHTKGIDSIFGVCLAETSKNPIEIIRKMMELPFCHMHGPEHHIMVGAALLTAYKNAGGDIELGRALTEMKNRGQSVPGGACGFWGACGAGISSGMFVSIVSGSTPLAGAPFGLSNRMTAKSLDAIGSVGGPRCCKRDSFLSILSAIDFVKEHFGIEMEKGEVVCGYSANNNQCLGKNCPFSKFNNKGMRQVFELRRLSPEDGLDIYNLLQTIPGEENGLLNKANGLSFDEFKVWLNRKQLESEQQGIVDGWKVPSTTYWLYADGIPVGFGSIRLFLTDALKKAGGHIGYGIAAPYRGKGYGKELLRQLLIKANGAGIDKVLITVQKDNLASQAVARANGGVLTDETDERVYYWIETGR